ncbi:ArsR/SmtB family transcription factor [Flavobacterium sp.]|uniref:ArsR/SmtB family transcription factor n=1 Tax=Flavobacterium sp. TaxID=239 RepID=UPI0039E4D850
MENTKPDVFAAIGDPTRRQILFLLTAGSLSINALAAHFPVSRPAISKHIKSLEQANLVSITSMGRERFCALDPAGFVEVRDWLAFYEQFWTDKMAHFAKVLESEAQKPT